MDIKKILALTVIVLAVFSCMSVVSAGLFDFIGGQTQVKNATYTFEGFTLTLPENANVTNDTIIDEGVTFNDHEVKYSRDGKNTTNLFVEAATGKGMVKSADEYKNNWLSKGAKDGGKYGEWTVIDINGVKTSYNNISLSSYLLVQHNGSKIIMLEGKDLNELKKVADTYKKV